MVRVVNVKNYKHNSDEILFKIDRTSPLGNPFYMEKESDRTMVCEKYKIWFDNKIKLGNDSTFMNYLNFILKKAKNYNIALGCHCYPARCHADIIKNYIDDNI